MTRTEHRELYFLLAGLGVIYFTAINNHLQTSTDAASYISIAREFWTTGRYTYQGYPATYSYPGLPLILSPLVGLFGNCFLVMRGLEIIFALAALAVTYLFIRRERSHAFGLSVIACTGMSFAFLFETTRILSDLPYFFSSMLALLAFENLLEGPRSYRWSWTFTLAAIGSALLRPTGLVLIAALGLYLFLFRRNVTTWKKFQWPALFILLGIGGWFVRTRLAMADLPPSLIDADRTHFDTLLRKTPGSDEQIQTAAEWISRVGSNIRYYGYLLANLFSGRVVTFRALWVWFFPLLFFAVSQVRILRKRIRSADVYFLIYFLVLLAWSWRQDERFLVPILPVLFFPVMDGFADWFPESKKKMVLFILCVGVMAANTGKNYEIIKSERNDPYYPPEVQSYLKLLDEIQSKTRKDAIFVGDLSSWTYLFSQRRSFEFPRSHRTAKIMQFIDSAQADFLLWTPLEGGSETYLTPLLKDYPDRFKPWINEGGNLLYAIRR